MPEPLLLLILDGLGLADAGPGNGVALAGTPALCKLWRENPHTQLSASGEDVGLPAGQMGNSEVGHTNIGAGRVVYQDLPRITRAIADGSFFENPAFLAAIENCRSSGSALHLCGLVSDGGVHSHLDHLTALVELAQRQGLSKVWLHAFLDGRDVSPTSGADFLAEITRRMERVGVGRIATVCGRYYAMDRDKRWDRLEKAYRCLVGEGALCEASPEQAVRESYANGVTDEFFLPTRFAPEGALAAGDSVIFFNFRPDRGRELTAAFTQPDFTGFSPAGLPLCWVTMTSYDAAFTGIRVAFAPEELHDTLGEVVSRAGLSQLRIAETEKYAHVTYFLNGGAETEFPGEERILIPSPKGVATYDLAPAMSAREVVAAFKARFAASEPPALTVLNLANCDMVGHTGSIPAVLEAVRTVDACTAELVDIVRERGGRLLITADHGNAEQMLTPEGDPMTAHTLNPVPLLLVGESAPLNAGGRLCDLAPTALALLGLPQPAAMSGHSLLG